MLATLADMGCGAVTAAAARSSWCCRGPTSTSSGERQPEVYGRATLADHVAAAAGGGRPVWPASSSTTRPTTRASSSSWSTAARGRAAALIVNAGALTHYSWSLHDALAAFDGIVVELHLSNPAAREPLRHTSVVAPVADGAIAGFGGLGLPAGGPSRGPPARRHSDRLESP